MGGFQLDGCGAKDYFTKIKFLGEHLCPNCNKVTPTYLEKGKFKISVFWIPTVTLKERYAIMCENCEQGRWIEDSEAYRLLNGGTYDPNMPIQAESVAVPAAPINGNTVSVKTCPKCGANIQGDFCGICGTKYSEPVPVTVGVAKKCPKCGADVQGMFCGICGTKYEEPVAVKPEPVIEDTVSVKKCPKCGADVQGMFCGICGTKYEVVHVGHVEQDKKPEEKKISDTWECSLCGTKNPQTSDRCSLCGCEKE